VGEGGSYVPRLVVEDPRTEQQIFGPLHAGLVGESAFVREIRELIFHLAASDLTVLVTGETGTGKDIVAQLLHRKSPRHGKPFIKVNCPAIPEALLESELFGYEKGAFTGALTPKPGRFELADKGTIFLDEISELSHAAQSKLLLVLDGEPFMRIGGVKPIRPDVRVVAATNVSLDDAVQRGKLRQDIGFRLTEVVIHMLPLRERPEDIPLLSEHFNYNYSKQYNREYRALPSDVLEGMAQQRWRGNIRELAARVKEYVATGDPSGLLEERKPNGFPAISTPVADSVDHKARASRQTQGRQFLPLREASRRAVEATERALIEEALRYTLWNRRKAAELLEISYSSLLRRIETYEIGKVQMGETQAL
jgi:two-component system, NtrC family, response regulator AtoC